MAIEKRGRGREIMYRRKDEGGIRNKNVQVLEIYFGNRIKIHGRIGPTFVILRVPSQAFIDIFLHQG